MKEIVSVIVKPNTKYVFAYTYNGKEFIYDVMQSSEIAVLVHVDGSVSVYPFKVEDFVDGFDFDYYEKEKYFCIREIRRLNKLETYIENILEDYGGDREEAIEIIANSVKGLPDFYLSEEVKKVLYLYM